ncbi:MAG: M3 family oligoendopeptidase [Anaerolineae bacterium]|nr:MAG: M3 family oligoendopeptidase [Anaerolineae bacterium]
MQLERNISLRVLPSSALELAEWDWEQVEAHYIDLQGRMLDAGTVEEWLTAWSRLRELVKEALDRLYVAKTLDTADESREARYNTYLEQIFTPSEEHEQGLKKMLLESGLEPDGFAIPLRNLRTQARLFREPNLSLLEQEKKLGSEYDKIIGAQTVEWEGETITLPRLFRELEQPDRSTRERAWRLAMGRYQADRSAINDVWVRLLRLRNEIAANADLPDYRAYRWQQLLRLEYTPDDCMEFHESIESVVVPAATRILERRRVALQLDALRPWDLQVDTFGREPLEPFATVEELIRKTSNIFHAVDPELGGYFDTMESEGLLDLDNSEGKAPGGYAEYFLAARRPFIFMNAVGTARNVETLLHEGGHAFHVFECAHLPYVQQLTLPSEFAEVASMSMELLAAPYLSTANGGFYSESEAARSRIKHLEDIVLFWPYMAVVDAFQHWAYLNPQTAADPDACETQWGRLWDRFMPLVDWSGLEPEKKTGWHRKLHLYLYPFYYVDYGLAQLGAVHIWRNATNDQSAAVKQYREALALGGTLPLVELYERAGAKLAFDAGTLGKAVSLIESTLKHLEVQSSN